MDISNMEERNSSAWQAVPMVFLKHFKEKLMLATNRTECHHVHPPKELTTEALSMIVLVTIFFIFAVLGSLSTAFEFLYEENTEEKKLNKNTSIKNFNKSFSKKDWTSKIRSFLHCFCFVKNWKKLFRTDPVVDFNCFHGLKAISNLSIICAHVFFYHTFTRSADELKPFLQNVISKLILNAAFSVDVFFVLSGFLNGYFFSKAYDESSGNISWWHFYLKRFLRSTPAHMILFGFHTFLLNYTGSGPIWPEFVTNPVCKENWWRYLLYINNFELPFKSCIPWNWYLATEMQLYIASPLFLLLLSRRQVFGYILAGITIFLSGLTSFLITKQSNLIECSFAQLEFFLGDLETFKDRFWSYLSKLHTMPYTRISPYLIGVHLGYYFYGKNFKGIRKRWTTLCFGWIAAGILVWISFFGILKKEVSVLEIAFYNGLKHIFFSVGLAWIIFVCLTEQKSVINSFLSWKIFIPFSKLSYSSYLIHMLIIQRDFQATQDLEEFSIVPLALHIFRVYFWSFIFSIPVSLLFEMPVMNLLKTERRDDTKEKIKKI